MKRCFCDGCGKELDYDNMNYVVVSMDDYSDRDSPGEGWDFCKDCATVIRRLLPAKKGE